MTPLLPPSTPVGILGAGAMGSGIAQVAALAGHPVFVADARAEALERAEQGMRRALDRLVEKGRLSREDADAALARVSFCRALGSEPLELDLSAFAECGIVVEAIVEQLDPKKQAFRALEQVVAPTCIIATNTSSLPVTAIAAACEHPERAVGLHFFNPAPLMPLVEVVPALQTAVEVLRTSRLLVQSWGKTTVVAADTPGFIVNRVARPFYGESLRMLEEGVADAATIDWAMRELGGFRMGPFELMDLIGQDVNYAVTSTVFAELYYDRRYTPAVTQRRLVDAGYLGRKTGRGFYEYGEGATKPEPMRDEILGRSMLMRVLAMLVNEAVDAVFLRIASVDDIELAMTTGVNYPRGLLAWGEAIGLGRILVELETLQADYGEDRYRPSPLLRRAVRERRSFFA